MISATATEVGLLTTAGLAASKALPLMAVLTLPVIFAAGMSLMDSADGVLMCGAYGWALSNPLRKVFYNLTITSLSVLVALSIGTIELLGVLADRLEIDAGPLSAIGHLNLDYAGYAIVGLFVVTWLAALAIWRFGRIEQKWSAGLAD